MLDLVMLAGLLAPSGVLAAQDAGWSETRFNRVHLRNDSFVDGDLIRETPTMVVLKVPFGEFGIRKDQIARDEQGRLRVELVKLKSYKDAPLIVPLALPARAATDAGRPNLFVGNDPGRAERPSDARPTSPAPPLPIRVKRLIDLAVAQWKQGKKDVEDDLLQAGKEGAPYLRWLVEGSGDPLVPLEPICRAIAQLEGVEALPFLSGVMDMKVSKERRAGIIGLSLIKSKEAVPLLVRALEDQSGSGWKSAMEALSALGKDLEMTDAIVDMIGDRLGNAKYKLGLAQTLTKLGTRRAHELILDLLRHGSDAESLTTALATLPDWKNPEDRELARPFLRNSDPTVRRDAASSATQLGDLGAVPDLMDLLGDENAGVQANAHTALKRLTKLTLGPDPELWKAWWEGGGKEALSGKSDK
jgi:HEAT repeat protein